VGRDDGSDRLPGLVACELVAGNNQDLEWRSLRGALGDDDGLAVGAAQEAVHDVQWPGSSVVVRHVEVLEHGERQRLHHHLLGVEESIRFPGEVEVLRVPAIDDEHLDVMRVVDLATCMMGVCPARTMNSTQCGVCGYWRRKCMPSCMGLVLSAVQLDLHEARGTRVLAQSGTDYGSSSKSEQVVGGDLEVRHGSGVGRMRVGGVHLPGHPRLDGRAGLYEFFERVLPPHVAVVLGQQKLQPRNDLGSHGKLPW